MNCVRDKKKWMKLYKMRYGRKSIVLYGVPLEGLPGKVTFKLRLQNLKGMVGQHLV